MKQAMRKAGLAIVFICAITAAGCGKEGKKEDKKEEPIVVDAVEEEAEEKTEVEIGAEEVVEPLDFCICIDPGHYGNTNVLQFSDGSSYCEGNTTLAISLKLKEILETEYGIEVIMTREGDDISIGGYSKGVLDQQHIALRGEMAAGTDLFLSIHTNANQNWANGYETCTQPIGINKPVVIANMVAKGDERALQIGNEIGKNLANFYTKEGLSSVEGFKENMDGSTFLEWTDEYNDSVDVQGTMCVRSHNGGDYYGVLRGASNVGVPGFIVEHGFHTVPEFRAKIANEGLALKIAQEDAKAIATVLGLE